ncbi:MAG: hypothetical protein RSA68_13785, partial [Hafnia sp.]
TLSRCDGAGFYQLCPLEYTLSRVFSCAVADYISVCNKSAGLYPSILKGDGVSNGYDFIERQIEW